MYHPKITVIIHPLTKQNQSTESVQRNSFSGIRRLNPAAVGGESPGIDLPPEDIDDQYRRHISEQHERHPFEDRYVPAIEAEDAQHSGSQDDKDDVGMVATAGGTRRTRSGLTCSTRPATTKGGRRPAAALSHAGSPRDWHLIWINENAVVGVYKIERDCAEVPIGVLAPRVRSGALRRRYGRRGEELRRCRESTATDLSAPDGRCCSRSQRSCLRLNRESVHLCRRERRIRASCGFLAARRLSCSELRAWQQGALHIRLLLTHDRSDSSCISRDSL